MGAGHGDREAPATVDDLLARIRDLEAERDELALGLPIGFYYGWFDAPSQDFRFEYVSPRAAWLLGVTVDDLLGDWRMIMTHVHPDDRPSLEYEGTAVTEPGDEADWTGRVVVDGIERWVHVNSREYESRPGRWLGIVADVTDRKHLEVELSRLAMTDPLTGLGNRRQFEEQAGRLLADWAAGAGPLALVLIDLDRFKEVNDTFGHHAGDEALREVGRILAEHGREHDVITRMGGDEYAVLMPRTDRATATAAASRFAGELRRLQASVPQLAPLSMSIGIVALAERGPSGPQDTDALLHCADQALYRAKAEGRDRIAVFDA